MSGVTSPIPPGFKSPMANEGQAGIEEVVLRVLADPRIAAERARVRALLEACPVARYPDGEARLDHALDAWLVFLAYHEANGDPHRSQMAWMLAGTELEWSDRSVPTSGSVADCPDNIYRLAPIDPESSYEIRGQLRPMHPAQFSFMIVRDSQLIPREADNEILGIISSRDMSIAADGSFTVTIGRDPAGGRPNHLQTQPGELIRLSVRDTLSSWLQSANEVSTERIEGPPASPPQSDAQVAERVVARMSDWVGGWVRYGSTLQGPPEDNALVAPYSRSGGWGYISFVRFHLADDEAIVLTIDDAASEYASCQITDIWGIQLDPQKTVASHTTRTSTQNVDGTHTYVVAPRDPGTTNWLDTGGLRRGWLAIRWQGVPGTRTSNDGLVRDYRVVDVSELPGILPGDSLAVDPAQRRAELEHRRDQWRLRLAEGPS